MTRVLVIDDSRFARVFARAVLVAEGFDVIEADNGETGVARAGSDAPDCIVLDLLMPNMGGLEVLKAIRAANLQMPIIVTTAGVEPDSRDDCLRCGATAVIEKANSRAEFLAAIRLALGPA